MSSVCVCGGRQRNSWWPTEKLSQLWVKFGAGGNRNRSWFSFHSLYSYWKSKSNELLPFCSTWDFCSHWAHLRTPALSFSRCAAPAKLPTWLCLRPGFSGRAASNPEVIPWGTSPHKRISKITLRVVVFQGRLLSHLRYTSQVISQSRTRVKLNRVFFPRWLFQARSLGCGFAR